jgi:hypothetical protein
MTPRVPDVGPGALVIRGLRRFYPVTDTERFTDVYWKELQKDCALHVAIGQFFFPLGFVVGAFLFPALKGGFTGWDVGVGFGAGIALAFGYQLTVCAVKGFAGAFKKMSDYSTMLYGIPWNAQFKIGYAPFLLAGFLCAAGRLLTT